MAVLALATSLADMRTRLGNMVIGTSKVSPPSRTLVSLPCQSVVIAL